MVKRHLFNSPAPNYMAVFPTCQFLSVYLQAETLACSLSPEPMSGICTKIVLHLMILRFSAACSFNSIAC